MRKFKGSHKKPQNSYTELSQAKKYSKNLQPDLLEFQKAGPNLLLKSSNLFSIKEISVAVLPNFSLDESRVEKATLKNTPKYLKKSDTPFYPVTDKRVLEAFYFSSINAERIMCAFCHSEISSGDYVVRCPTCNILHHVECWSEYGNRCSVAYCTGSGKV